MPVIGAALLLAGCLGNGALTTSGTLPMSAPLMPPGTEALDVSSIANDATGNLTFQVWFADGSSTASRIWTIAPGQTWQGHRPLVCPFSPAEVAASATIIDGNGDAWKVDFHDYLNCHTNRDPGEWHVQFTSDWKIRWREVGECRVSCRA